MIKRGAQSNPQHRFSQYRVDPIEVEPEVSEQTQLIEVNAKSIVSENQSPDIPFRYSINPYNGCEHGCVYCYARPSHSYHELSPGLDFERKILVKTNTLALFKDYLTRPRYQCQPIMLAGNTDIYQPAEQKYQLTQQLLKVCLQTKHPIMLITKSALILRDIELLHGLAEHNLVSVAVSVTSLDKRLSAELEPRASSPKARLSIIRALAQRGIPVTAMFSPIIPCLNDCELEGVVSACAEAGAHQAHSIFLRLPYEVDALFQQWLDTYYPARKEHVMSIIRQSRGGKHNESEFGTRMKARGQFAAMIQQRFKLACKRAGLSQRQEQQSLNTQLFDAKQLIAERQPQLSLGF